MSRSSPPNRMSALCQPPNKQLQRTVTRRRGAPQVRHFIMHMRRAGQRSAPPLNCGVMRLPHVVRWILIVPSAIAAWYFALLVSALLFGFLVAPCMDSDGPQPYFCEAAWYPRQALFRGIYFFGAGLSAFLVVAVSALMAPSHRTAVAWTAVATGAAVASVMTYGSDLFVVAVFAIACGATTAVVVSRAARASRHSKVTRTSVVPNA